MTAAELITNSIPVLQTTDTVRLALELMQDNKVQQLPVVNNQVYAGLIDEGDLEDADENELIAKHLQGINTVHVSPSDFFLVPLKIMHQRQLDLLPVVKETGELMGVLTQEELLWAASHYNSAAVPGGIIIFQMQPNSFYLSEIGRIVESNNARIIHLNTWTDGSTGELMVAIKVNKSDIQDILASFERYQYNIVHYFGENLSEEELKENYDHLINYLNI